MQTKIVITGGPGTGKSTVLNELARRNFVCMEEVSREVTLEAQAQGIAQLFLHDPLAFSRLLMERRVQQFIAADTQDSAIVFFDRGIPDVHAYMDFSATEYPSLYHEQSNRYRYTEVFLMPPWEAIYTSDNERYENFKQAVTIHQYLMKAYRDLGYRITEVPFGTVSERTDFILSHLNL